MAQTALAFQISRGAGGFAGSGQNDKQAGKQYLELQINADTR